MTEMRVVLGSEQLLASDTLKGLRVGIVSNPASVDGALQHIVPLLAARRDVTLAAVFGPQHGFRADVQDNMVETSHATDVSRRVPVYCSTARPASRPLRCSRTSTSS